MGLDIDNLTPAQSIRLDRAATLRLELDDIESRKLVGAQFDAQKYIAISEALERLMGGTPGASTIIEPDCSGAREAFSNLIAAQCAALEKREVRESDRLRAEVAKATNEQLRGLHPSPASPTPPPEQPTSSQPPQTSNQPPLPPPNAAVPPHYLRRDDRFSVIHDGLGRKDWSNHG